MSAPRIRAAQPGDLATIAALEEELFGIEAWDTESLLDDLERPGRTFVVADLDGEVVGHAITMLAGDIADLMRIGVDPSRQREGIARRLLDELVGQARDDGADRMLLEVSALNREAISFYAATGFTQVDVRANYYKDGSDALVMKRPLGPSCNWSQG
ncbi:ribosomal protein S18-alanine N-acetyltransferase [Nocardioides sp. AE5]|uniref:ribosomal protein S18-alanine N-acetyltransferase n=1 Tax=Nocardioides sp. AE5 TaxID=2962573 RepID=UPI002881B347|nr:ribosomal protein S18-alanine N-acetyltransferase [Nocardioides sp. AE5]MDT0202053.1 ribosomal protein S18-alanine N-acetyltransferase [Nocardioides sp. AE5]